MPSVPPYRSGPLTVRTARHLWVAVVAVSKVMTSVCGQRTRLHHSGPMKKTRTISCHPFPHTDPTRRLRAPPVHLRVAVVVAATAMTLVRGRRTRIHHSGTLK
jgi:hypothetical protein